jgi:hypothetical protein
VLSQVFDTKGFSNEDGAEVAAYNVTCVTVWPEGRVDALYMRRRDGKSNSLQKADFHVWEHAGPFLAD